MTARMISTTTEPATSGIGWLHGIASQVSLPNMSPLRLRAERGARAFDMRPGTGRKLLVYDGIEQGRIDRAISERTYICALLAKREVTRPVQRRCSLARPGDPLFECVLRDGTHHEIHVGKPVTAKLRGLAIELPGFVRRKVKLGDHSVHGGDHAAELRHKEHVHHGSRSQREMHWDSGGNDKLVDACNALIGVDE